MKKQALLKQIDQTIKQLQAARKKVAKLPDLINTQLTVDEGGYTDPQGCGEFNFSIQVVDNKHEPKYVDIVLEYDSDDDHAPDDENEEE